VPHLRAVVALVVGFQSAELARGVVELEPADEGPYNLGPGACTSAWEADSTCFVAPGTEGSTFPAVGKLARSSYSLEYLRGECWPG